MNLVQKLWIFSSLRLLSTMVESFSVREATCCVDVLANYGCNQCVDCRLSSAHISVKKITSYTKD